MRSVRLMLFGMTALLFLSACTTGSTGTAPAEVGHAELDLAKGVKIYEEGDYASAIAMLQHALLDGLTSKSDQARAYKYLAFIHCTSEREKQCREAFKKALEVDPGFDLQPAEAGHPVWGPVFRSVKGSMSAK